MRWPTLVAAGLIYAAAISPWASQRLPRFSLPMLAATGAVLIVGALVRSLVRLVRARWSHRRLDLVPVLVNTIAALVLVVSPASRLVGMTIGGSSGRSSEAHPAASATTSVISRYGFMASSLTKPPALPEGII